MAAQSASSVEPVTSLRFTSSPRANFLDPLLELGKVRSGPVDLFAARAAAKLVVVGFGKRFEFVDYFSLRCLFQPCVASQAAREGRDRLREIKASENLYRLLIGVLGARAISMVHDRVHE